MRNHIDVSLTALFQDVPVPKGLAGRLLDRLAADRDNAAEASAAVPLPEIFAVSDAPGRRSRRFPPLITSMGVAAFNRRRLIGGGLLAAAAGLLLAIWLWPGGELPLSEQFVLDEAIRRFDAQDEALGYPLSEKSPPAAYPFSQMVLRVRGAKWRSLTEFLDHRGVVYDLPGPAGTRAALFVVDRKVDGLGTTPRLNPFTTSGYCASAWQEEGLLYVLVVQGDPATYGAYLNLPRSPVA